MACSREESLMGIVSGQRYHIGRCGRYISLTACVISPIEDLASRGRGVLAPSRNKMVSSDMALSLFRVIVFMTYFMWTFAQNRGCLQERA